MSWLRVTLECHEQHVDALAALFEQFDAVAVSSEAVSEEALYAGEQGERHYWQRTAVSGLFDNSIDLDILIACAANRVGNDNLLSSRVNAVMDENWLDAQRADQGELVISDRLCIRPSWVENGTDYPACLRLDPGLAFGSGRHASTALCLEWLAGETLTGRTVIDYGCGSGILGLCAVLLGAAAVYALDIDPQAREAARNNAIRNQLLDRLHILDAEQGRPPPADILIANILLDPLVDLAPHFTGLVKRQGKVVLSGLLAVQVEACRAAYAHNFDMRPPVFRDEWALLEGHRPASRVAIRADKVEPV